MCDQTEIDYIDGEVVWVKLGSLWWPGEVVGSDKLPPDLLQSFRKPPIAVVTFFQEDTYEYVKNINSIYKYHCSRKEEFIKKGLDLLNRTKNSQWKKFRDDVTHAETVTSGDTEILSRDQFKEVKKESYAGIFGDSKTPNLKKGGKKSKAESPTVTPVRKGSRGNIDYKVHYLLQGSNSSSESKPVASTSSSEPRSSTEEQPNTMPTPVISTTPTVSTSSGMYTCHACAFSTSRLNVMILHNKTHSVTFTPYIPSPIQNKSTPKSVPTPKTKNSESTPKIPKVRKPPKARDENKQSKPLKREDRSLKRCSDDKKLSVAPKKLKTDEEIKTSLLADWDDEWVDDNEEESMPKVASPEIPVSSQSPAVPTSTDCSTNIETNSTKDKADEVLSNEKPEASKDSRFEFCEDEDWPLETDVGRKIPRVKNASKPLSTRSIDEEDVAKEVAELLEKTAVPELPAAPEPLKAAENFPDASAAKSPDKVNDILPECKTSGKIMTDEAPIKTIFKTKTFFRSRHSRSQDAIEKYIAEQLNSTEKMDSLDNDINGSDETPSPEARDSPPLEPIKVARLAPKIQLKKAQAQLKENSHLVDFRYENQSDLLYMKFALELPTDLPSVGKNESTDLTKHYTEVKESNQETDIEKSAEVDKIRDENENKNTKEIVENKDTLHKQDLIKVNETTCENNIENDNYKKEDITPLQLLNTDEGSKSCVNSECVLEQNIESDCMEVDHTFNQQLDISKDNNVVDQGDLLNTSNIEANSVQENTTVVRKIDENFSNAKSIENEIETVNEGNSMVSTNLNQRLQEISQPSSDGHSIISTKLNRHSQEILQPSDDHSMISTEVKQHSQEISQPSCDDHSIISTTLHQHHQEVSQPSSDVHSITLSKLNQHLEEVSQPSSDDHSMMSSKLNQHLQELSQPSSDDHSMTSSKLNQHLQELSQPSSDDHSMISSKLNQHLQELSQPSFDDHSMISSKLNQHLQDVSQPSSNDHSMISTTLNQHLQEISQPSSDDHSVISTKLNQHSQKISQQSSDNHCVSNIVTFLNVNSDTIKEQEIINSNPPEDLFNNDTDTNLEQPENNINGIDSLDGVVDEGICELDAPIEEVILTSTKEQVNVIEDISHLETDINHKSHDDLNLQNNTTYIESMPSESDLQVAEALINFPSTLTSSVITNDKDVITEMLNITEVNKDMENSVNHNKSLSGEEIIALEKHSEVEKLAGSVNIVTSVCNQAPKLRFVTEEEESENLNAAQSLVQMSETLDLKIATNKDLPISTGNEKEYTKASTQDNNRGKKAATFTQTSELKSISTATAPKTSKLMQILVDPTKAQRSPMPKSAKSIIIPSNEKILNCNVSNNITPKITPTQKVIIRKTTNKKILNNGNESLQEKIILRTKSPQDGNMQTYTIHTTADKPIDSNTIIIQQKQCKISKPPKLQKIKPAKSMDIPNDNIGTCMSNDDALFDINSMPVILSDDIITPESIEKMPIVMSDGNIITNPLTTNMIAKPTSIPKTSTVTKTVKMKHILKEASETASTSFSKPELKTLIINPVSEVSKSSTPNILSKSSKLKGTKPLLIIDKTTGKQKIVVAKSETALKELKAAPQKVCTSGQTTTKPEKFIILPSNNSPRPAQTQKIVIDPQSGKAHVLLSKPLDTTTDKPISAKLVSSASESGAAGGTVMIITNAQGTQSRIVLTPEHEKILFPKKQSNVTTHLRAVPQRQISSIVAQKQPQTIITTVAQPVTKTQTKIVPKQQKSAIITSKGQLIVGGKITSAGTKSYAPMPEVRAVPTQKRIVTTDSKKTIQTVQKPSPGEPLIFLQQKSGAVMQLTAAQFEHLQRTGQIVQKQQPQVQQPIIKDNKIVVQKTVTIKSKEPVPPLKQKQKTRLTKSVSAPPAKKIRREVNIAPAVSISASNTPALAPLSSTSVTTIQPLIVPDNVPTSTSYPNLENFEELLPSTAIVKQPEPPIQIELPAPQPPAPQQEQSLLVSDGNIMATPGEPFGGPPGSFLLCLFDNGMYTPIDNRPLALVNNQLVPMTIEPIQTAVQPERRDILEAAIVNSDVLADTRDEAPDFRDLNANVSVHSRVSETSTTLNQPIMTPIEVPTNVDSEPTVLSSLEDGLAVIGVTPHTVPTSLELPITVTDPRIAPKTTDPLSNVAYTTLLSSPNTEMVFEECVSSSSMSMPILTDEDTIVGKSMPILTEEVIERTASSIGSTVGSPCSIEVRESEIEDGSNWSRRLLTPGSDSSETSAEIPLQPAIQLSVSDLSRS